MLEFFRKYQRSFFLAITIIVITSFVFFGAFSTFTNEQERQDESIGKTIQGSSMMLSEVQKLSRFIAMDREDVSKGVFPNLCNDGVIRYDFLKSGLASLIVQAYFEPLKEDLATRLEKAKRFRFYVHPEAPLLSAQTVWDHFLPEMNEKIKALQGEQEVAFSVYTHLEKLYQLQQQLRPEMLRQILVYQNRQNPQISMDPKLMAEDFSLFGFSTVFDWFGKNFVDLMAEFILNTAGIAEEKGYRVSLEEAKGDLIHLFQDSMQKLLEAHHKPEMSFQSHLQALGFDERSASQVWQKVLLFRRYFQDVGQAAFIDKLPYKGFAGYAKQAAVLDVYRWPISLRNQQDLQEFEFYVKAISKRQEGPLPDAILPVEEIEKNCPQLVQTTYKANIAQVFKKELALKPTLKEVWSWEVDEKNWPLLRREFSLRDVPSPKERFEVLERLDFSTRSKVDSWSREKMVDEHPEWIEEALRCAPKEEITWSVSLNEPSPFPKEGTYALIEDQEIVEEKKILTFQEARKILSKLVPSQKGEYKKEKNPFFLAALQALQSLQENQEPSWIAKAEHRLLGQFKLQKTEETLLRTSKENWMKEQAFLLLPKHWSPIHIGDQGEIVFFYLQEKKTAPSPILDQLAFGKETLAADAKAYAAERLLQTIKKKHAIVIPLQKEDE